MLFEYEFWEWGVRISEVRINESLLYHNVKHHIQIAWTLMQHYVSASRPPNLCWIYTFVLLVYID